MLFSFFSLSLVEWGCEFESRAFATEVMEGWRSLSEDNVEDLMTVAEFTQSSSSKRRSQCSPTSPNLNSVGNFGSCRGVYKQRRARSPDRSKANSCALDRANELQTNLDYRFPSFVKSMLPSQIDGGFWMGLPSDFCKMYLPEQDTVMKLIDENDQEYKVNFLATRHGLSGGWRCFSIEHELVEGDALVFQLIMRTEFKVYIFRAGTVGVFGLLNSYAGRRVKTSDAKMKGKHMTLPLVVVKQIEGDKESINDDEVGSVTSVESKDPKALEDFTIEVNGVSIDSELSNQVWTKYYELCCSQNALLHKTLEGTDCKLVAGIISETIKIVEEIRASKLTTPRDKFTKWDRRLGAFEQLGLNVGFIRSRVKSLLDITFESEKVADPRRYNEAKIERARAKEDIRSLKQELGDLKESYRQFKSEIKRQKHEAKSLKLKFQREVDAPW